MSDFSFLGLALHAFPPDMAGKFSGRLVIVSSGRCVWDDLQALGIHGSGYTGFDVMCVNDVVMHYPGKVRHLYSNDRRRFQWWLECRRDEIKREFGPVENTHSCRGGAKYLWPWPGHGTSGLGAVYTGIALGYDEIVLCGVPLDDSGHYFDPPWKVSNFTREVGVKGNGQMQYWAEANRHCFKGKVKSMSGRTRELLGAP